MKIKYPAILALIAQVISTLICFIILRPYISFPIAVVSQGILAAITGKIFKLNRWWLIINLLFVPLIILFNTFQIQRWIFLVGFVALLLINWNSLRDRVPLYLTGDRTRLKLEEILRKQNKSFSFIDLGSGLAGTLYQLSLTFPDSQFFGVETAPLVFLISWFRCLLRKNCTIRYRSIWSVDLSSYDVVYCFLSPVPMPAIWDKAQSEMKKGSLLISNTFEIPGVKPTKVIELKDWRDSKIIMWQR